MKKWILVNIGCIECGVSSDIVGVFTDKARADALANELLSTHGWREGGQNDFIVFEMPKLDTINDEYLPRTETAQERPIATETNVNEERT